MEYRGPFQNSSALPEPVEIQVEREARRFVILWTDGHRSVYPFELLRRECPCAICAERRRQRAKPLTVITGPVLKPGEVELRSYKPVGRYALNLIWNDGHETGIYSFDLLRALCPCDRCRQD